MKPILNLLCCLYFLAPLHLYSQDLTKEGLIVLRNGDILTGEIRCKNWSITPQNILFRSKGQESFTEYGTEQIKFFEAGGNRYWRAEVLIDRQPVGNELDASEIVPEHSYPLELKTVFLKCIVSGTKYDLLELVDNTKNHYYVRNHTGEIALLRYKVYLNARQNIEVSFDFRETLHELNRKENNDRSIQNIIMNTHYYASSLSRVIEALNQSDGKIIYKSPAEQNGKAIRFFAGAAGGITVTMVQPNWGLRTSTGNMAGIIGGFDISMGYSCNGGESFFRFDVLIARMLYAASISSPENRRIHESLQYGIVPSVKIRLPLFTLENLKAHVGGGFTIPIHLSEEEKINRWKTPSFYDKFPWVAYTVGGQIDFEIMKRFEIGLGCYQAPSVDFGVHYYSPIHYYTWVAYRF